METENVKKEYYDSGQLHEECHYNSKNELHGLHRLWHENGQLQLELPYENGSRNGAFRQWDKNGRLFFELHYQRGEKHGAFRQWDKKGNLRTEYYWKDIKFQPEQASIMVEFLENIGYKIESPQPVLKKKRTKKPS